jgi:hypothetical protein
MDRPRRSERAGGSLPLRLRALLRDRHALRRRIVLSELLGPPVSLEPRRLPSIDGDDDQP